MKVLKSLLTVFERDRKEKDIIIAKELEQEDPQNKDIEDILNKNEVKERETN